jgi:2,3,4,5-tetrahydropyridine-2,6-dicarboxylate N-succinyltransferase
MSYETILDQLESGDIRAAIQQADGTWIANIEAKQAILAAFGAGNNVVQTGIYAGFVDKNTLPARRFSVEDKVRLVPGGSSVRRGAYVAPGVIIMPPAYVNIGAYIDEGSMVDSHALVGSCAQIGKHVHLSAGVQIGGVLEPVGLAPVVIEDNVFVGAGSVVVEGIVVKQGAVIAPGVTLSKAVPVYDCVNECVYERGAPIPENAVVIPGTRPINTAFAKAQGLHMATPIIVKYRDAKSNASLALEEALR